MLQRAQQKQRAPELRKFPPGWDEKKVRRILKYYEQQAEEEAVAEDEAACEASNQTIMKVPRELVPSIAELIAKHKRTGLNPPLEPTATLVPNGSFLPSRLSGMALGI